MYDKVIIGGGAATTGGALALTGSSVVWMALAAFAMLAVGTAILRIVPRKQG
ncbi:hypothetical protein HC028_14200 [Planosporangium flavigriseum]|uniref:Uncharacterized protein n=1 Tax=Planosporangium flavigriseum TaxID=373681 RepID=A0A8J3LNU8_9ACTN|nr:hypothetical protein [Planosporangium flavigriseum]NJC65641.1 hypothetical protein [Planosporangium flavigriseum]GIG74804.1 hypothetical protein Pfl04_32080 [Planosporangium flavigriseum]